MIIQRQRTKSLNKTRNKEILYFFTSKNMQTARAEILLWGNAIGRWTVATLMQWSVYCQLQCKKSPGKNSARVTKWVGEISSKWVWHVSLHCEGVCDPLSGDVVERGGEYAPRTKYEEKYEKCGSWIVENSVRETGDTFIWITCLCLFLSSLNKSERGQILDLIHQFQTGVFS